LDAGDPESVQTRVRHRILRAFARRAILDKADCKEMKQWAHGGGFSRDATVRSAANDRQRLERLLRYWARAPFAAERREEWDGHRLIYQRAKPGPDGRTQLILSPLELIERIAALVPPPRQHRHRYYGVLAPTAPVRAAVTALATDGVATPPSAPAQRADDKPPETPFRSPARYLWAMLLARLYEAFPLTCPQCGTQLRLVAFITAAAPVQRLRDPIGEPAAPPRIAPARGPPSWEEDDGGAILVDDRHVSADPLAQSEPEYELDQRLTW
jgi:hypothetical protein